MPAHATATPERVRGAAPGGCGRQPAPEAEDSREETPRERSERFLAALGLEVKPPAQIDRILALLDRVLTRGGHTRRTRLENCGVAFPTLDLEGRVGWERRGCRDRWCPDCAHALSQERAQLVRDHWLERQAAGVKRGVFLTLTRPKVAGETAREAVKAVLKTWRDLNNARDKVADGIFRSRTKRAGKALLPGGLRALEVTARAAGTVIRGPHGAHEVKIGGVHAHLHVVGELADHTTPGEVAARVITAWTHLSGGSPAAQDVQPITFANIYQVTKYSADFASLATLADVAPGYALAVIRALHGVRIAEPWGTWRGCLEKDPAGVYFGDRSVAALAQDPTGFIGFGKRWLPAVDILEALRTGTAPRWGELRRAELAEARERVRFMEEGRMAP